MDSSRCIPSFQKQPLSFFPHLHPQCNGDDVIHIKSDTPTLKDQSELGHLLYKYMGRSVVNNLMVSISGDQNKEHSHVSAAL